MNKDKENSVISKRNTMPYNKSKENRNNLKKSVTGVEIVASNPINIVKVEKERKTSEIRKSVYVRDTKGKENVSDRRKSVSPVSVMRETKLNKQNIVEKNKKKNVVEDNINLPIIVENPQTELLPSTPLLSSSKRKYTQFTHETHQDKSEFQQFEDLFTTHYLELLSNNPLWLDNFQSALINHFSPEPLSLLPRTFSDKASLLLHSQQFWMMWITHIKMLNDDSPVETLINNFNMCFNYINEDSIMKPFYLKTMREVNEKQFREYLLSKGKIHLFDYEKVTNQMLFSLVEPYALLLLASKDKFRLAKEEKKMKSTSKSRLEMKCDNNIQISIESVNKINIINNNEEEIKNSGQKENPFNINYDGRQGNLTLTHNIEDSFIDQSFITPKLDSKRESMKGKEILINPSTKKNNITASEYNDKIGPLISFTQTTEYMIVSQNTIDKQMEFLCKLDNSCEEKKDNSIHLEISEQETIGNFSNLNNDSEIQIKENNFSLHQVEVIEEETSPIDNKIQFSPIENTKDNLEFENNIFSQPKSGRKSITLSGRSFHTRSRKYDSVIEEEYPNDLVEGSVVVFNQSFTGNVESERKSNRRFSIRKENIDNDEKQNE